MMIHFQRVTTNSVGRRPFCKIKGETLLCRIINGFKSPLYIGGKIIVDLVGEVKINKETFVNLCRFRKG